VGGRPTRVRHLRYTYYNTDTELCVPEIVTAPPPMLRPMPVLVVGADTPLGAAITRALDVRHGERRAFVSDPGVAESLKQRSWKVAVGDVSDGSHVGGAALGAFSLVLVPEAAFDGRERAFAQSPAATVQAWAEAASDAGVTRVIWLQDPRVEGAEHGFSTRVTEVAVVATEGRDPTEIAHDVARLDDLADLGGA
jgi:hypothetical protein